MEVNQASPVRKSLGKTAPKGTTARTAKATAIQAAYKRLFDSRDGKVVLVDLFNRFYDCEISESDTTRDVGKRDVLLYIKRQLRVTQ